MTKSIFLTSRPRAATSVATRILNLPCLYLCIVISRQFYDMSPCMTSTSNLHLLSCYKNELQSAFVYVKTIVLPCPPQQARTSARACRRLWQLHSIARCQMFLFDLLLKSWARSTFACPLFICWAAISRTQAGTVAEKRQICKSFFICLRILYRIFSMSSLNPILSI